jgi:hypothetical protein
MCEEGAFVYWFWPLEKGNIMCVVLSNLVFPLNSQLFWCLLGSTPPNYLVLFYALVSLYWVISLWFILRLDLSIFMFLGFGILWLFGFSHLVMNKRFRWDLSLVH